MKNLYLAIIGANGYMGSRIQDTIKKTMQKNKQDYQVTATTRNATKAKQKDWLYFDLQKEESYFALRDCSVIINVADTTRVSPLPFLEYLQKQKLEKKVLFIETSSFDATAYELITFAQNNRNPKLKVLVGAGVFPGISNVLAQTILETQNKQKNMDSLDSLDFIVQLSPFSAAGKGMTNLMAALVSESPKSIQNQKIEKKIGKAILYKQKNIWGVIVGLSDTPIHFHAYGLKNSRSVISLKPQLLNYGLYILMRLANEKLLQKFLLKTSEFFLYLLRGIVFSWAKTNVFFVYRSKNQEKIFLIKDAVAASAWFVDFLVQKILYKDFQENLEKEKSLLFASDIVLAKEIIEHCSLVTAKSTKSYV